MVPLANPHPGATALQDLGRALGHRARATGRRRAGDAVIAVAAVRWRRARPATWAERVARDVERTGRRAGRPRRPSETFVEYATALDRLAASQPAHPPPPWSRLAAAVEASVYGGREPPPETQHRWSDQLGTYKSDPAGLEPASSRGPGAQRTHTQPGRHSRPLDGRPTWPGKPDRVRPTTRGEMTQWALPL